MPPMVAVRREAELKYALNVCGVEIARFPTLKKLSLAQLYFEEASRIFLGASTPGKGQEAEFMSLAPVLIRVVSEAPEFLKAAKEGDAQAVESAIEHGMPVNFHDPATGATALHYAAAHGARGVLRALLRSGKCDFLVRDGIGRLPSELAELYGQDSGMARLLRYKEVRQAQAQGITLRRREIEPEPA